MNLAVSLAPEDEMVCAPCRSAGLIAADDDEDEEKPKAKKKRDDDDENGNEEKKKGGKKDTPAKTGMGLYIGLGVGAVLLLSCCCCSVGGGGWWYSTQSKPAFVGNWDSKIQEKGVPEITLMIIENGKGVYIKNQGAPVDFTWKNVSGNEPSVQLETVDQKKTLWTGQSRPIFTWKVDAGELTLRPTGGGMTNRFTKAVAK